MFTVRLWVQEICKKKVVYKFQLYKLMKYGEYIFLEPDNKLQMPHLNIKINFETTQQNFSAIKCIHRNLAWKPPWKQPNGQFPKFCKSICLFLQDQALPVAVYFLVSSLAPSSNLKMKAVYSFEISYFLRTARPYRRGNPSWSQPWGPEIQQY